MNTLRIATRKSPLALWQSEHVAAALRAAHPGPGRRAGADEHARRRGAGPLAGRDRRQGPVPQGTGAGDAARRGRLRRAFAQGRADGAGAGLRAAGDPARAPITPTPSSAIATTASTRCRRARASAPRRCAARRSCARCGRTCSCSTCAATSTRAWPSSMPATTTRSCWPAPACSGSGFDDRIRARLDAPDWLPAPAQGAIAIECRDDDAATQRAVRGARPCRHAHLRRGRARDEPRAARQLPRAGGGVRAAGRRSTCTCTGLVGSAPRRPRRCARRRTGTRRHARRPRPGSRRNAAGAGRRAR